jgi:shikimate dehydrogenase
VNRITGATRLIAHIGVPTTTFRSPQIYNPWFEACGADVVVVPMGARPEEFPQLLPLLFKLTNMVGALITMPHKASVVGLLDEASPTVKVAGSCNAVKIDRDGRLIGDMFDGEGFVRGVRRRGKTLHGARAIVAGCGGVGSAIAASLAAAGVVELALFDPHAPNMLALAQRLRATYPALELRTGSNDPSGHDLVVNATPLGMNDGDPLPFDVEKIAPDAYVGEVVMKRDITPFVAAARARGCEYQIGVDMLFEQIPAYLEFFDLPVASSDELRSLVQSAD